MVPVNADIRLPVDYKDAWVNVKLSFCESFFSILFTL